MPDGFYAMITNLYFLILITKDGLYDVVSDITHITCLQWTKDLSNLNNVLII